MASTPEVKVKKQVVSALKAMGTYYFYPVTGGYGASGVPDIIVCYKGLFVGIECKAGRNTPTALQDMNLAAITANGGLALVINEDTAPTIQQTLEAWATLKGHKHGAA